MQNESHPWAAGECHLVLHNLDMEIAVPNIDKHKEKFGLLRKMGLGTSDSSAVLNVNPFTPQSQLVEEKIRGYLTEEEKGIGSIDSVRKGRELEPLIIQKSEKVHGVPDLKPTDMYRSTIYPWMTFNFDGVLVQRHAQGIYIPDEIKVLTRFGEKHYDLEKAWYTEKRGFGGLPEEIQKTNNTIKTKASLYGIPPYYYTQIQQQIFALKAPYGYLTILRESKWELHKWFIWRDDAVINDLIITGNKLWTEIEERRGLHWDIREITQADWEVIERDIIDLPLSAGGQNNDSYIDIMTGKVTQNSQQALLPDISDNAEEIRLPAEPNF